MATLREYFDTDFSTLLKSGLEPVWQSNGLQGTLSVRVHFEFDANTKFVSVFVPAAACQAQIMEAALREVNAWLTASDGLEASLGREGEVSRRSTALRFAGRVFLYHEIGLDPGVIAELLRLGQEQGLALHLRGPAFAAGRARWERPRAFISHDSRDKDAIARPIAISLSALQCPVWFDEFSLTVGDRLRESVERGIREAHKCILVLTPHFLQNTGWTREEFDAVFTRELIERTDVLLPVWCGVTQQEVFAYSPSLANRFAANWANGSDDVVRRLRRAIGD